MQQIMPDSDKVNTPLHYRFIEDSTFNHPTYPSPSCPISIVHGIKCVSMLTSDDALILHL